MATATASYEPIYDEEVRLAIDPAEEIPTDTCWGALTGKFDTKQTVWVIDSGATRHMTYAREVFTEFVQLNVPRIVKTASGAFVYGTGMGNVHIQVFTDDLRTETLVLTDVLYVPALAGSLISASQLQDKGILVQTTENTQERAMVLTRDGSIIANATRVGSQYILDSVAIEATMAATERDPDLDLWHRKFGHIGVQGLRGLHGVVSDLEAPISVPRGYNSDFCEPCIMAKQLRVVNRQKPDKTDEPLGRVFSDFWGPYSIPTIFGERYICTLTDQATRKSWTFLTKQRTDFREVLLKWKKETELQSGQKLKILRLDNAGEFKAFENDLRTQYGVKTEWTTAYTPEQNGVSERLNRTLISLARAMLIDARLPYKLWGEAVKAACYIRNRTPIGPEGMTPEEAFSKKQPGIMHLKPWGCVAFHRVPDKLRYKLEPVSQKMCLVGYTETTQQYRLYDPVSRRIVISTRPRFLVNRRLKWKWSTRTPAQELDASNSESDSDDDYGTEKIGSRLPPENLARPALNESLIEELSEEHGADSIRTSHVDGRETHTPDQREDGEPSHEALGRGLRIRKPRRFFDDEDTALRADACGICLPKSYDEAISDPQYAQQWKDAIADELVKLQALGTWEYAELPPMKATVGTKWVFTVKYTPTGLVHHFKARLVAQGYSQRPGDDFCETFSPTIRYESIRALLAVGCAEDLEIHHADVDTAYPRAKLHAEVYIRRVEGLTLPSNVVLKVRKALYGLKQSAREWYIEACNGLAKFDLKPSFSDPSVFVNSDKTLIVGLYVDDMIILGPSLDVINTFKKEFGKLYKIKDLGEISMCLGLDIVRDRPSRTLTISQKSYTLKLVNEYLGGSDRIDPTPTGGIQTLGKAKQNEPRADISLYQKTIGSLMYLQRGTRPDITFAVCRLAQYCTDPTIRHWNCVLRVLRYLKGTAGYTVRYGSYERLQGLKGYSDSDYAGDPADRLSTYGYIFTLCGGPVAWTSKKQRSISTSTTEAEYVALCQTSKQAVWYSGLLRDIGYSKYLKDDYTVPLLCDNQSAIALAENPENHARSKHIDVQFHYVRQLVAYHKITVDYCSTSHMLADALTKPLRLSVFRTCVKGMLMEG